jgi:D-serine deaminase-like pyridoxal phosphate-dependent protein
VMSWEGHSLSADSQEGRRQAAATAVCQLVESAGRCRQAGIPVRIVSCGGSGTLDVTPFQPGVTEIQAGGAIFNDVTYAQWNVPTESALFVRSSVTSRPVPERIIIDAGWKTSPSWMNPPLPLGIEHVCAIRTSAEHGYVILSEPNHEIKVGDGFDFVVGYGDNTVFLHDLIYGVRAGVVETVWRVEGRGRLR